MSGACISRNQICDGNFDCPDNSDEQNCNTCEPNEFKCNNGKCVLKTWRCDGEDDCFDNSDEQNCSPPPGGNCRVGEFQCGTGQCIPSSYQCDLHSDCSDTTDEIGCTKPTISKNPPPMVNQHVHSLFNVSCRAVGVPVPLINWRLNWGHIPSKCTSTSVDGLGVLTCPSVEVRDSGAYSCEAINSMGTTFATPDTILRVDDDESVCRIGTFNSRAERPDDCINCFCFGMSTQCSSADLYTYSVRYTIIDRILYLLTFPQLCISCPNQPLLCRWSVFVVRFPELGKYP